ncbi:MAG: DEAD/DEAH box helicase, partial [Chitinophagaceae bacterium]|nr:DEAD/DEAH box helicase [Chitinophagaceae bacterium]
MNFTEFNFAPALQEGLEAMRFEKATPIQEQAIPIILAGNDIMAFAQTGTGKTAAFLLPILHKLTAEPRQVTDTLVVVPTRELALQIDQALQGFAYFTGVDSIAIYGGGDGMSFEQEKKALTMGANIIIATPGRLMSHLKMGYVKFNHVRHLVLDESDKMLDMGFVDDIRKIASYLPEKKQTLLFSATMAPNIKKLAQQLLVNPQHIALAMSKPAAGVAQSAYVVYPQQKPLLIEHILKQKEYSSVLVFASTKLSVKELDRALQRKRFSCKAIHSDLEQAEREDVLRSFRAKKTQIIVATDILSRGIDIEDINLVINYDVPGDAEDYVHRVGRTARASTTGEAITLISPQDQRRFHNIETLIESIVPKMPLPEALGEGPNYEPEKRQPREGRSGGGGSRHGKGPQHRSGQGHKPQGGGQGHRKPHGPKSGGSGDGK